MHLHLQQLADALSQSDLQKCFVSIKRILMFAHCVSNEEYYQSENPLGELRT